jgi:hypothetical protein
MRAPVLKGRVKAAVGLPPSSADAGLFDESADG